MTNTSKGKFIAIATDFDDVYMRDGGLSLIRRDGEEVVEDFEEAVKIAEENVRNGRAQATLEVVELAVVRRAVIKRAVEVVIS